MHPLGRVAECIKIGLSIAQPMATGTAKTGAFPIMKGKTTSVHIALEKQYGRKFGVTPTEDLALMEAA